MVVMTIKTAVCFEVFKKILKMASAVARDRKVFTEYLHNYDLSDFILLGFGDPAEETVIEHGVSHIRYIYRIDADLVTVGTVEILKDFQDITDMEIYFEGDKAR